MDNGKKIFKNCSFCKNSIFNQCTCAKNSEVSKIVILMMERPVYNFSFLTLPTPFEKIFLANLASIKQEIELENYEQSSVNKQTKNLTLIHPINSDDLSLSNNNDYMCMPNFKTFNKNYSCVQWQTFNNYSTILLLNFFIELFKENCDLKKFNMNLLKKINNTETFIKNDVCPEKKCNTCIKLQDNLTNLTKKYEEMIKKYSVHQSEKEKLVMKYATSEKRLIDAQRLIRLSEAKYQDYKKENDVLNTKIFKLEDNNSRLVSEINSRNLDIMRMQNEIVQLKENNNVNEIKLKWTQNKLECLLQSCRESQGKLSEANAKVAELTNNCERLQTQSMSSILKVSRIVCDKEESDHHNVVIQNDDLKEYDLNENQELPNEENPIHTKFNKLLKELSEYKSKLVMTNSLLEKKKKEVQTLKIQVSQIEKMQKKLKSYEQQVKTNEIELKHVSTIREELILEVEAYRQREIQMLEFTQKLTDRNVQLQCELSSVNSEFNIIINNQSPLKKNIEECINKINNLENTIRFENRKRINECEILGKYVADLMYDNKKLVHLLEYLEGENTILQKKYQSVVRELTKEMNLNTNTQVIS